VSTVAIDDSSTWPPSCLLSLPKRRDEATNLRKVLEEAAEEEGDGGDSDVEGDDDGGDSDVEGDDARDHDGAKSDSLQDKDVDSSIEDTDAVEEADENCVILARGAALSAAAPALAVIHVPETPTADWTPPVGETEKGEPVFAEVENPGGWSQCMFWPKFGATAPRQCKRHSLPAGAQPVLPSNQLPLVTSQR
jgi:hypothetical protein